jgi:hypothetical protein
MKLAFYKGVYGNVLDWLIMLWTMGQYSHVELVFSDGVSFSSSQWDGGVRFKKINYSHKERWGFIELEIAEEKEQELREKCEKLVGKKYDWLGIMFDQFIPLNTQDSDRWWCSEIVAHILDIEPERVSPNRLYRRMMVDPICM